MNSTTSATSLGLQQAARRLGFLRASPPASRRAALITGPGEIEPTRMPCLNTWRRTVCTKQLIAHFDDAIDRLPRRREMRGEQARDDDVAGAARDHVRQHVVDILHHTLTLRFSIRSIAAGIGIDEVAADIDAGIGVRDVELAVLSPAPAAACAQAAGSSRSMTSGITASPCLGRAAPASAAASRSTITTRAPHASIAPRSQVRCPTPPRSPPRPCLQLLRHRLHPVRSVRRAWQHITVALSAAMRCATAARVPSQAEHRRPRGEAATQPFRRRPGRPLLVPDHFERDRMRPLVEFQFGIARSSATGELAMMCARISAQPTPCRIEDHPMALDPPHLGRDAQPMPLGAFVAHRAP